MTRVVVSRNPDRKTVAFHEWGIVDNNGLIQSVQGDGTRYRNQISIEEDGRCLRYGAGHTLILYHY